MKSLFLKIFFFVLVSVYAYTTVGVCIFAHYCGGELEKVSLFSKPSSCCDGEDSETNNCCNNDSKYVSFQSNFTFYVIVHDYKASVTDLFVLPSSLLNSTLEKKYSCFFIKEQKVHPPNLVQQNIVSSTVIRV